MGSADDDSNRDGEATGSPVGPSQSQVRSGAQALSVLATPLNLHILMALAERPMRLAELREAAGLPPQSTLRGHLANLAELGVLEKRPTRQVPYIVESELTPMGRDFLGVAGRLQGWLDRAPGGPISLESAGAKGAVKALIDGWGSRMMRELVVQPLSLTELSRMISDLSYPALERRLSSMRIAGLVEAREGTGMGIPYAVTDWARRGVGPLIAASHCELVHLGPKRAPITEADIEAAFLLATPLVGLTEPVDSACQLRVEPSTGVLRRATGVQVTIERGEVVYCDSGLDSDPVSFAAGRPLQWFHALRDGKIDGLEFGGSTRVAEDVVAGLHAAYAEG